ncbi:TPA: AIPR family protein [Proteus mirabilis]|uniref:Abortive phage infection protein C-terminal domain-containing protein n=4 Tax=Enterobacterales TaxID=91347 RepID=D1P2I3_9GAMM|nr:hypothetical protein HMPREF0693_2279 [Proteus mirabilis ATCC 29906]EFB72338.1 hypothetical protein PROVRUST_06407 [Providencia rustigianii DSM 4541]NBN37188.1 hypothetical protein [Proteus sp. G4379]QER01596.1 hypothetical protein EHZ20_16665 [Proteus mirabilis]HEJ9553683.1 AIPR family protein [Proteus mirabilis]
MKGYFMSNITKINHPIISSYVYEFIRENEIEEPYSFDQHLVFEMFLNSLVLEIYTNDTTASYQDMETGTAIGIDGVAIFVADKLVTSIEDVDLIISDLKRFDVNFYFTQAKTTESFIRQDMNDFFNAVIKFFSFDRDSCLIPELSEFWEIAKHIYKQGNKFKSTPKLNLIYASLAPSEPKFEEDIHLKADLDLSKSNIKNLNLFNEEISIDFFGIKQIMELEKKSSSQREIVINISKTPVSYPKHPENKIQNAYFGLIKIEQLIEMISDDIGGNKRVIKKGIFDDNIRYYLGANDKNNVNLGMKEQLEGCNYHLFGLLNNGITVICDEAKLNSEELTLVNYQIVNGCQTSNVIFELIDNLGDRKNIFIPVRFIATEDEETKNSIIKGTNSQTSLTQAQLMALSNFQKAIERYYSIKQESNRFSIYYERRTEQYRGDDIPKTKIINIPIQIKCVSALFFNLPHEVSGQYGKVEKSTSGLLFENEKHLSFLNVYYVSGLCWYKVERFVQNHEEGRKFRRARWHIMMLFKLRNCDVKDLDKLGFNKIPIDKKMNKASEQIEKILLKNDDFLHVEFIRILNFIKETLVSHYAKEPEELFNDRKLFERKETTTTLINANKELRKIKK